MTSYRWPSPSDGGLLARIHAAQHPRDCSGARFLVWRSMEDKEADTRGLTAWAHGGASQIWEALTDGDQYGQHGSRVLLTDDELWPMARGCKHGPQTRECYFEPLSGCSFRDVQKPVTSGGATSVQLKLKATTMTVLPRWCTALPPTFGSESRLTSMHGRVCQEKHLITLRLHWWLRGWHITSGRRNG